MNKYGWKQQKREKKSLSHEDAKTNLSSSYDMLMDDAGTLKSASNPGRFTRFVVRHRRPFHSFILKHTMSFE